MIDLFGPVLVAAGFGAYMATNLWLGRFRRNPWEFFALSALGVLFSVVHVLATPSGSAIAAAVVAVAGLIALYWFLFSFSMYGTREDRPNVGHFFPAFCLAASDGQLYDSRTYHGSRRLFIFYRGSW